MKCLCCGKEVKDGGLWHETCVKNFFGTSALPKLELNKEVLRKLADESTNKGFTVPGVQKKMSLHLSKVRGDARLTLVGYPAGYILKPQTDEYAELPEAEYLVMQMAKVSKIKVVPFALLNVGGEYAYITKRIDRKGERKLAMEDFCQLDERLTQDKYKGSYERCAAIIRKYSSRPGLDLAEFFTRVVFSFAVGNSDMHLKNFSLVENAYKSNEYVLSEAYDMLPVNVVMPEDTEELALTLCGKKSNLDRADFLHFANGIGINEKAATRMIDAIVSKQQLYTEMCAESFLSNELKERMDKLIVKRIGKLK